MTLELSDHNKISEHTDLYMLSLLGPCLDSYFDYLGEPTDFAYTKAHALPPNEEALVP